MHIVEQDSPVTQALNDCRRTRTVANTCRNCGGEWPHTNNPCPAKNKECRKCKKLNHFARVVGRETWFPQVKVQPSKAKVGTTIFDLLTLQILKKPVVNQPTLNIVMR